MTTINTHLLRDPDWMTPPRISITWRTTLQKSLRSDEKRLQLFSYGRVGIEYLIKTVDYAESAYMKRKVFKFEGAIIGIPLWPYWDYLQAQALSGQNRLEITATVHTFFQIDRNVVVVNPSNIESYEAGVISALGSDYVDLDDNLVSTWDAESWVLPVIPARIGDENSFSWITDNKHDIRIIATEAIE